MERTQTQVVFDDLVGEDQSAFGHVGDANSGRW